MKIDSVILTDNWIEYIDKRREFYLQFAQNIKSPVTDI